MGRFLLDKDIAGFLSRVTYKDWNFLVEVRGKPDEGDVFIQPVFHAPDSSDKASKPVLQKGRKWFLSRFSCDTEIVQTAWAAVKRAELHEMQEQFRFDGVDVFNNHISIHALKNIAGEVDQRDPE
jgi:hypothetical protein